MFPEEIYSVRIFVLLVFFLHCVRIIRWLGNEKMTFPTPPPKEFCAQPQELEKTTKICDNGARQCNVPTWANFQISSSTAARYASGVLRMLAGRWGRVLEHSIIWLHCSSVRLWQQKTTVASALTNPFGNSKRRQHWKHTSICSFLTWWRIFSFYFLHLINMRFVAKNKMAAYSSDNYNASFYLQFLRSPRYITKMFSWICVMVLDNRFIGCQVLLVLFYLKT